MAAPIVRFSFSSTGELEIPFDLKAVCLIEEAAGEPWIVVWSRWAGVDDPAKQANTRDLVSIVTGLLKRVRPSTTREEVETSIVMPNDLNACYMIVANAIYEMLPPEKREAVAALIRARVATAAGSIAPKAPKGSKAKPKSKTRAKTKPRRRS